MKNFFSCFVGSKPKAGIPVVVNNEPIDISKSSGNSTEPKNMSITPITSEGSPRKEDPFAPSTTPTATFTEAPNKPKSAEQIAAEEVQKKAERMAALREKAAQMRQAGEEARQAGEEARQAGEEARQAGEMRDFYRGLGKLCDLEAQQRQNMSVVEQLDARAAARSANNKGGRS